MHEEIILGSQLGEAWDLVSGQLQKELVISMSSDLSLRYGQVVLVSGYLDLTAFN